MFGLYQKMKCARQLRNIKYIFVVRFRMCILASREFTCIHPSVSQVKNKTEECRKSIENKEVGRHC